MSIHPNNLPLGTNAFHFGETYYKSLAESIPQFVVLINPDDFNVKYINRVIQSPSRDALIGKSIFDFVSPEHAELYREKFMEIKENRKPVVLDIAVNSTRYSENRAWYRANISIIPGDGNSIDSLLFILENVTENKLSKLENINASERIKAIINNTSDIICSIDSAYNLLEFNSSFAAMIKGGYNLELKPGMCILQFIDPAKHESLIAIYKRALQGEVCTDISKFNTLNGFVVYNETSYNPIYNSDGKISGISIFSKDITERMKSEQKMAVALKEKEVLLSEIHHRIKNNLAMVSSLLQLQEMNIVNPEAKEVLVQSRKRIKSTALIHELLYRSESFRQINLKDYLIELFQHLKINDHVSLVVLGDEVMLDLTTAMPLGLMLNEIMLNSFKHSHKNSLEGKTEINTSINNKNLIIDYCDCKGSFPDDVDFKNSKTTGLTLIHTFTEQLNGNIELISKNPPKYRIQIPLHEN
jgi:PAS domain S-box-containing protein